VSTLRPRPRKLEQPDVVWALLDALRRGESLPAALRSVGVAQSTFYRERRNSPLLRGLIAQAEAEGRAHRAVAPSTFAPPIEHVALPVEPMAPPVEAAAPPAEAVAPPVEPMAPPAERAALPVEPIAPPTERAAPPVQPVAPPTEPVAPPAEHPARPRPVEQPNVAGLLERLAPGPASRTVVVSIERAEVGPRRPSLGERARIRPREDLARLASRLTAATRATALERLETVHSSHAEERLGGSHWLLPQLVLAIQLVVAVLLVGGVSLPLGIAAVSIAYLLAFRQPDAEARPRPLGPGPAPIEEPVDASHDLRWLDATLARRPPITRSKQ
jgi:hypothetical protein